MSLVTLRCGLHVTTDDLRRAQRAYERHDHHESAIRAVVESMAPLLVTRELTEWTKHWSERTRAEEPYVTGPAHRGQLRGVRLCAEELVDRVDYLLPPIKNRER